MSGCWWINKICPRTDSRGQWQCVTLCVLSDLLNKSDDSPPWPTDWSISSILSYKISNGPWGKHAGRNPVFAWNQAGVTAKPSPPPPPPRLPPGEERVHLPPSFSRYPPLPVFDLTTLVVRLSHAGIISAAASEAYGNVTGRRWTRWLLTHSHPPTGRPLRSTSATMGRLVGVKQKAGLTDKHSLTDTHIYIYIYIHPVCWIFKLLFQKLLM